MKVTAQQRPAEFDPVTLTITLETAQEVQALYDVVNNSAYVVGCLEKYDNTAAIHDVLAAIYVRLNGVVGPIGHGPGRIA